MLKLTLAAVSVRTGCGRNLFQGNRVIVGFVDGIKDRLQVGIGLDGKEYGSTASEEKVAFVDQRLAILGNSKARFICRDLTCSNGSRRVRIIE